MWTRALSQLTFNCRIRPSTCLRYIHINPGVCISIFIKFLMLKPASESYWWMFTPQCRFSCDYHMEPKGEILFSHLIYFSHGKPLIYAALDDLGSAVMFTGKIKVVLVFFNRAAGIMETDTDLQSGFSAFGSEPFRCFMFISWCLILLLMCPSGLPTAPRPACSCYKKAFRWSFITRVNDHQL